MATQVTEITYPPIQSQATTTFIEGQVDAADRTGSLPDDFKLALANILSLDVNNYSIDDLWKRYIIDLVAGDANARPGNPAAGGRGHQGHVGQGMSHYYSKAFRNNPSNANAFPGGSLIKASEVKFRTSFNGADGQTSHVSQDSGERTATFSGTVALETSKRKHGNSSLVGLTNGYLTYPASTDFDIPAGADWTVEGWVYAANHGADNIPILALPGAFILGIDNTGSYGGLKAVIYEANNSDIDVDVTHTLLTGEAPNLTWNHIAFTKSGTTLRGFIAGVEIFSTTVKNLGLGAAGVPIRVGSDPQDATVLDGYIDSLRMIVGTALYTTGFTPPTAPLYGGEAVELGAPMDCYYLEETWTDGGSPNLAALLVPFTTADQITGFDFDSTGTRLLLSNLADDETYSYLLSTPFDFSTAVETGASDTTVNPAHAVWGAAGGTYTVHELATDTFNQYTLSTPYVMEATPTLHSNAREDQLGVTGGNNAGCAWNSDGTAFYACGNPSSQATVTRTALTGAAYDLDSLGTRVSQNVTGPLRSAQANENAVWVDSTETNIYIGNLAYVVVGVMSTPGDFSTVTWKADPLRIYKVNPIGLEYVAPDGSYMLIGDHKYAVPKIYKWTHMAGAQI